MITDQNNKDIKNNSRFAMSEEEFDILLKTIEQSLSVNINEKGCNQYTGPDCDGPKGEKDKTKSTRKRKTDTSESKTPKPESTTLSRKPKTGIGKLLHKGKEKLEKIRKLKEKGSVKSVEITQKDPPYAEEIPSVEKVKGGNFLTKYLEEKDIPYAEELPLSEQIRDGHLSPKLDESKIKTADDFFNTLPSVEEYINPENEKAWRESVRKEFETAKVEDAKKPKTGLGKLLGKGKEKLKELRARKNKKSVDRVSDAKAFQNAWEELNKKRLFE